MLFLEPLFSICLSIGFSILTVEEPNRQERSRGPLNSQVRRAAYIAASHADSSGYAVPACQTGSAFFPDSSDRSETKTDTGAALYRAASGR